MLCCNGLVEKDGSQMWHVFLDQASLSKWLSKRDVIVVIIRKHHE